MFSLLADVATPVIALGATAWAVLQARVLNRCKREQLARKASMEPMCQCSHSFSRHANGRRCQTETRYTISTYNFEWRQCPCVLYVGPDPSLSGLWHLPFDGGVPTGRTIRQGDLLR